jgi:hypothetical protein
MCIVIAIVYSSYVLFIINQQRRCRVALRFTWFVVFLALIWHDVYNYGKRRVWRYQRGNCKITIPDAGVAAYNWKAHNEKIEIISFVVKFNVLIVVDCTILCNQQRRCRVALHFTWFVVFLALIWHDVYNYGKRRVWRYQRGNQNLVRYT